MSSLKNVVCRAKNGDSEAIGIVIERFKPLIIKKSYRYGHLDEDCYQECVIAIIKSIGKFEIR